MQFIEVPASKTSLSLRKLVHGVGVNDANYITRIKSNGKWQVCPFYSRWVHMLGRCYDAKYQEKRPTYIGCTVCDEWLVFSVFKKWMATQEWRGNHLDKDMVVTGSKLYSPNKCIFISPQINTLMNDNESVRGDYPLGVSRDKRYGMFVARCSARGVSEYLGVFKTQCDANHAYKKFKSNHIKEIAKAQDSPLREYLLRRAYEYMA